MFRPNRANLARLATERGAWAATSMHPNPRYYKYLWQIFTTDSPCEDGAFFANAPRLCTHEAMVLIERLTERRQRYAVYNRRLPRGGPGVPFDFQSACWQGYECAQAYDDDPDPVWNGFK